MKNEINEIKKKLIAYLTSHKALHKCKFAYVFGSINDPDRFTPNSDIDLAVYLDIPMSDFKNQFDYLKFYKEMNELFDDRDVDLIILNTADIIITMQALTNGQLLLSPDEKFLIDYKARKASEYIDFKMFRKKIEETLLAK